MPSSQLTGYCRTNPVVQEASILAEDILGVQTPAVVDIPEEENPVVGILAVELDTQVGVHTLAEGTLAADPVGE